MNFPIKYPENNGGMNDRIKRLHEQSLNTPATLTIERALIETAFYKENEGKMPIAVLRARNFYEICKKKTIYIGDDELVEITPQSIRMRKQDLVKFHSI